MYTLDGEPICWNAFCAQKREDLTAAEMLRAAQLQPGESMTLGGGAGAEFVLARVDAPTTSAADPRGIGYEELRAQIASLKEALGPDLAGRDFADLLTEAADVFQRIGDGPLVDCLRAKAEQVRDALASVEGR